MPKDQDKKVETISVTRAKAEAGLDLKPGHKTIIIIEDGHGTHPGTTTTYAPGPGATTTAAPGGTTTAAPGGTTTSAPGYTTTSAPGETTTSAPGATTTAPSETTTAAPGETTTSAPGYTTTAAPGETTTAGPAATTTAAPGETTTAGPAATTTAAPGETTTAGPAATTTAAPGETTTAPSATTTAPAYTTTTAPAATTTAPAGTTTAPAATTTAPAATTTAPAATTTAPAYTTTAPAATTTAPAATTTHPATTTTAPAATTTAPPATTTAPAATTTHPATTTTRPAATTTAPAATTTQHPATTTTAAPAATTTRKPVTPSAQIVFGSAHFDTDKILPLPGALETFKKLVAYANANPNRIYLVVGHTDAQPPASHNPPLSRERAQSIIQFLHEDADAWLPYYDDANKGITSKTWGVTEDQHMLKGLGLYTRDVSGRVNADYTAAVRTFQRQQNIAETGNTSDRFTRKALITAYMAIEGTSIPDTIKIRPLACGQGHQIENKVNSETNRRVDVFAFESEPILPAPETCEGNKHPNNFVTTDQRKPKGLCDVYETWLTEVTEQIGG